MREWSFRLKAEGIEELRGQLKNLAAEVDALTGASASMRSGDMGFAATTAAAQGLRGELKTLSQAAAETGGGLAALPVSVKESAASLSEVGAAAATAGRELTALNAGAGMINGLTGAVGQWGAAAGAAAGAVGTLAASVAGIIIGGDLIRLADHFLTTREAAAGGTQALNDAGAAADGFVATVGAAAVSAAKYYLSLKGLAKSLKGLAKIGETVPILAGATTAASTLLTVLSRYHLGAAAVSALWQVMSAGDAAYASLQAVQGDLAAKIAKTGSAAGMAATEILELAAAQERTSKAGRDGLARSMAEMASSGAVFGDEFRRAAFLIDDLAEKTGKDLPAATKLLAAALTDPARGLAALTAEGVRFSYAERSAVAALAETGDSLAAQRAALELLEEKLAGVNGFTDTAAAAQRRLDIAVRDLAESWGKPLPLIADFKAALGSLLDVPVAGFLNRVAAGVEKVKDALPGALVGVEAVEITRDLLAAQERLAAAQKAYDEGQRPEQLEHLAGVQSQVAALEKRLAGVVARGKAAVAEADKAADEGAARQLDKLVEQVDQKMKTLPQTAAARRAAVNGEIDAMIARLTELKVAQAGDTSEIDKQVMRLELLREARLKETEASEGSAVAAGKGAAATKDQTDAVEAYIAKLGDSARMAGVDAREREIQKAVMEAQNLALKDGNLLTEEQTARVRGLTAARIDGEDARRAAEKATQDLAKATEKTTDDVVKYGADAFADMMAGNKRGWQGMLESLEKTAYATFARIAAEAILRPVVQPVIEQAVGAFPALFGVQQAQQLQQQGGMGSAGNLLSLGSKFMPSSWTSGIGDTINTWGADLLGTGMPATVMSASEGAAAMAANQSLMLAGEGSGLAGSSSLITGVTPAAGGASLTAYLGSAGAGAFGGMFGGMIGTAAQSKAVGAASGALLGAGSAGLASLMGLSAAGGPVGLAIGALTGALTGALGTSKKPRSGGAASATMADGSGAVVDTSVSSRYYDPAPLQNTASAVTAAVQALVVAGAKMERASVDVVNDNGRNLVYVNGSSGPIVSNSDDPAQVIKDYLLFVARNNVDGNEVNPSGDPTLKLSGLGLRAAETATTNGAEYVAAVALAEQVAAGKTALDELDKSLAGLTASAKKAALEGFKPLEEELKKAKDGGFSAEWRDVVGGRLKLMLDQFSSPVEYTGLEQSMAALKGQMQAMRDTSDTLGLSMRGAIDAAETAGIGRLRDQALGEIDRGINAAAGKDYVNTLLDIQEAWKINQRQLAALGGDATKTTALAQAQISQAIQGLDATQAAAALGVLSGGLGDLVKQAVAAKTAADAAADAAAAAQAAAAQAAAMQAARDDLRVRKLRAGGDVAAADALALSLSQSREAAEAAAAGYDAVTRAMLAATQAMEAQAAAQARVRSSAAADAATAARANAVLGRDYRAGMIRFDGAALEQLRAAIDSGQDVAGLAATLQAERAATQVESLLAAIDRQISALGEQTQAVESEISARRQLKTALGQAADGLLTDKGVSNLSAEDRLTEAERQFRAALAIAKDASKNFEERQSAAARLDQLGRVAIDAEKSRYADARDNTFVEVEAALREVATTLGDVATVSGGDAAKTATEQLKELQSLRKTAADALTRNTLSVDDLKTTLTGAVGNLTTSLTALKLSGAAGGNTAGAGLTAAIFRAATSETAYAGQVSQFAGYSLDANRFVDLARALGYAGAVGGGQLTATLDTDQAFRARLIDAVSTYDKAAAAGLIGKIPGFADGGVSIGPQLAWVSEGRHRVEAHVPLPDGRRIPVAMSMQNGGDDGGLARKVDDLTRTVERLAGMLEDLGGEQVRLLRDVAVGVAARPQRIV